MLSDYGPFNFIHHNLMPRLPWMSLALYNKLVHNVESLWWLCWPEKCYHVFSGFFWGVSPFAKLMGHALKIGDRDASPQLTPFFQLILTHSLFWLPLIQWPPFSIIDNKFLTIAHWMTPFCDNISSKLSIFFAKFLSKMCPNLYFAIKNGQNFCNCHRLPPFYGLLTE